MSVQAQIDVQKLMEEIHKIVCTKCKKKLENMEIPIVQRIRPMDLIKKPTA